MPVPVSSNASKTQQRPRPAHHEDAGGAVDGENVSDDMVYPASDGTAEFLPSLSPLAWQ